MCKSGFSQGRPFETRAPITGGDHHKPGNRTNNHGIPKSAGGRNECLPHGIFGLRRRGDDRRTSQPRFIGKKTACDAIPERLTNPRPQKTANRCLSVESPVPNLPKRVRETIAKNPENDAAPDAIKNRHERYQPFANFGNRLDAAENDNRGQDRHDRARNPRRDMKCFMHQLGNRIGLNHIANTEGGNGGEKGKQDGEPFLAKPALQHIHRAASHCSLRGRDPIMNRQEGLGIFGRDPEDAGEPHPENGPRPAGTDGSSHPNNVAGADGGGQGGSQRPKLADLPFPFFVTGKRNFDGGPKVALDETKAEGQEKMGPYEQ